MMAALIHKNDLPCGKTACTFEGYLHGDTNVSFFLSDSYPGHGPSLHMHPYEEIFIVQEGQPTFTVGDETIIADAGSIVIVPPQTPHKFTNSSTGNTRHIDIHVAARMETTWLED